MKRLFILMIVTVLLGLVAYAFIWAQNEKVGQEIVDFFPRKLTPKAKLLPVDALTGDALSGDVATGSTATGAEMVQQAPAAN